MNKTQRGILVGAAIIIASMLLFPPFHFFTGADSPGRETNYGYSFVFKPPILAPARGADDPAILANVNWALLLTQWIGVIVVAGMLFAASRD